MKCFEDRPCRHKLATFSEQVFFFKAAIASLDIDLLQVIWLAKNMIALILTKWQSCDT
jgi:hypothetical protein